MGSSTILTVFLLIATVFGDVCRPKTDDDLVNLVTRREWFAQNNVDYMLSLNSPSNNAYLDIGPTSFGENSEMNFFVSVYPTAISASTIFHAYSTTNSALHFKIQIKDLTTFAFTLGTTSFEIKKLVRSAAHVDDEDWNNANPAIELNSWNHINIDFVNMGNSVTVNIHVNKRFWNKATINGTTLVGGLRDNTYLGASWNFIAQDFGNYLVGFVDNLGLFGVPSTRPWRTSCRTLPFTIDSTRKNVVQLLIDFNDALVSIGTTTVAITKTVKPEVFWVVALFKNGASFVPRSSMDKWFDCYATGDPHGYKRLTSQGAYTRIDYLEDQAHGKVFVRCGGDPGANSNASELEVRTYTRYTYWWRWSVFRLVAIRYIDWIYRINLDEQTSGIEHPDLGYKTPKLNIPGGVYRKHISSATWDPIPYSKDPIYILEETTGAQYAHFGVRSLLVKMPGFGHVRVDAPEGVFSSCRYMNLYVLLNEDLCPKIKRGKSTCDDDLNINADPLYRDWLPPPPLPDVPTTTPDPCSSLLVSNDFLTEVNSICSRIYPTDQNRRDDCKFDACAAGDIEVVLINRPAPECLLKGLNGDTNACEELVCPNFCSFRGTCNTTSQKCICDAGYVGKDCGQKKSFSCYDLTYGTQKVKVSSQFLPDAPSSTSNSALVANYFGTYGVEGSALIYTVYQRNSTEKLFIVNNHANGPNSGSYKLCITANNGSFGNAVRVNKSNSRVLGKHETVISGNCFTFTWEAFGSGGVMLDLTPSSGQLSLTFSVSMVDGLKQVLYASPNGKGDLDVLKVPAIYHNSFTLDLSLCDAEICSIYDQKCQECSSQPKCGYCVESGRCMLGDKSGPFGGVCNNWRFSFNESVSRVVTVDYDTSDLVNPDTEVFLTSSSTSEEAGVPVNVYVPTLLRSYATDVVLLFATGGDLANNAQQIKRNFANVLGPLSSDNMNLGLGFYDVSDSELTLSLTRVDPNNFFTFTRALEATIGRTSPSNGGQKNALELVASGNSGSVGFRRYSKKFAFITVYGFDSQEKNDILSLRDAVLDANFIPIWVVMGDNNDATRDFFQTEIIQNIKGIPGIVLSMQNDASNLLSVLRYGVSLGSALPSIVLKNTEVSNNHIDFNVLNAQPDTLFISGLADNGLRAWFRIPMKRGDTFNHVAQIVVPGYGKSTIADVGNTRPVAISNSFSGDEGTTCLQVNLRGNSYKNLLPVIFFITSLPQNGVLFEYDSSKDFGLGQQIQMNVISGHSDGTTSTLCYKPNTRFFHGTDSFTFKSYDGCALSDDATISITINDINLTPISIDTDSFLQEKESKVLPAFFRCIGGDDGEVMQIYVQDIKVIAPSFLQPFDTNVLSVGGVPVTVGWTGGNHVPLLANNYESSVDASYQNTSPFFFGVYEIKYKCVDDQGLSSGVAKARITVSQIIDPPVITLKDYTPIEDQWYEVIFDVRDYDVPLSTVVVNQQSALQTYLLSQSDGGVSLLSVPFTCYSGTAFTATCSFFFKLSETNRNSCPGGFGNCNPQFLETSVTLKVTASDGETTVSSSDAFIELSVYPKNDPPVITTPDVVTTPEFTPVDFNVILTDPDMDFTLTDIVITNNENWFTVATVSDNVVIGDHHEFTVRVSPQFNIYGTATIQINGYDGQVYSTTKNVLINVTYVNDPPTKTDFSKTLIEDTPDSVTITTIDVDNDESELIYRILSVPLMPNSATPKYKFYDNNNGLELDLSNPLPSSTIYVVPAPDYFTTSTPDKIEFSVTDTHRFDNTIAGNVRINNLFISVTPVNDPPACSETGSFTPLEDIAFAFALEGSQPAYGESNEAFKAIIVRTPFDPDTSVNSSDNGRFYQYDSRYTTLKISDFEAVAVPIKDGDMVTDDLNRIIYVPPKDKNSDPLQIRKPLWIQPRFTFKVADASNSTSSDCQININIVPVPDAPVAWAQPWTGRTDIEYMGINPSSNTFNENTGQCFRLCRGEEDQVNGLKFYIGGHDVEFVPKTPNFFYLNVKLISAECPVNSSIMYKTDEGTWKTLSTSSINNYILPDRKIEAGSLHDFIFNPAPNTFNQPNPNYQHDAYNGQYSEKYCSIVYSVIDSDGYESAPAAVDITIQEKNDIPQCVAANNPRCLFLKDLTTTPQGDANFVYNYAIIEMYEDEELWLYINYIDQEHDAYVPHILECDKNRGKFNLPNGPAQSNYFEGDGTITDMDNLRLSTTLQLNCKLFENFPIVDLVRSNLVGEKGYYIKFVPNQNEFGNQYNKLGILVEDEPTGQTQFAVFYYFITVLPVNDYPDIYLNSLTASNPEKAKNNWIYEYHIGTGTPFAPIHHMNDVDTIPNVDSMVVDIRFTSPNNPSVTCLDNTGATVDISSGVPFRYVGTLFQVNETLKSLLFTSQDSGFYEINIYLNDNGATGNCPPENGQPAINNGACPRETKITLKIEVADNNNISGPLGIGASAGLGAFLIGGIVAGVFIARKLKDKKKDSWIEFDEENFKDYAGTNPLYEQRSRSVSNPIYVSRESLELNE